MKYILYAIALIIGFFLFVPLNGSTEIRNLPLLVVIVSLILLAILVRLLQYGILMSKAKRMLCQKGMKPVRTLFLPWLSRCRGRYSMMLQYEGKNVQIVFLCRKRKYQRYHFERDDRLEFYSTNRVVFKGSKVRGATISNAVETNLAGKQKLKWNESADSRMILFDKLPEMVTDSIKRVNIEAGERICDSDISVWDWKSFSKHLNTGDIKHFF